MRKRCSRKSLQRCTSTFVSLPLYSPSSDYQKSSALVVATTLALCYMAATIPIVLALLLALVAALGLRTLGPLIGATALIELRVSLKDKSEMMHA